MQIPNIYRFFFQLLDIGNKGFVCDHDLFQFMWALTNDKYTGNNLISSVTPAAQENLHKEGAKVGSSGLGVPSGQHSNTPVSLSGTEYESVSLSLNYKDFFYGGKSSVYAEAFQQDFNSITKEMNRLS